MNCLLRQMPMVCLALGLAMPAEIATAAAPGNSTQPELIARVHSAGLRQVGANANGRTFKEIWSLPATAQLRDETLGKLAGSLATSFEPKGSGQSNCAELIRPLMNDLWEAELVVEMVEHTPALLDCVLAVHLDEARGKVWQANWSKLLTNWKLRQTADHLEVLSSNAWFAVRWTSGGAQGASREDLPNSILQKILKGQQLVEPAHENWVTAQANLTRCLARLGRTAKSELPRIDLAISGRKELLRSEARLTFKEPLAARSEKWDIPINTIRDPLISFTALQGIGPWLGRQPWVKDLGLDKIPNQLCLWELSQTAFQLQAAAPVPDANVAFQQIEQHGVQKFNKALTDYAVGNVVRLTNRTELAWRGLPILVPYLNPVSEGNRGFLHAGIFPVNSPTNAAPPQLFHQLTSQTNLVYYDWEITQARLNQLRPLLQLAAVFLTVSPMSTNSTASRWLDAVEPRLGNTVTEVAMTSPQELKVVRTSHLGANALELLSLANWLEGTNFPKLNLDLRFRPAVTSRRSKPERQP